MQQCSNIDQVMCVRVVIKDINTIYKTIILHLFNFCNISFSLHIHKQAQAHMHAQASYRLSPHAVRAMESHRDWRTHPTAYETGGSLTCRGVCVRVGECRG